MQILYRGAESIIYLDSWEGQKVLVKERIKKSYRIAQIDERLRKERTNHEVKLITDARSSGVHTPQIYHVDNDKTDHKIIMEFIEGVRIKELLNRADATENEKEIRKICEQIGQAVGRLHKKDIIHGDLTTSNMILQAGTQGDTEGGTNRIYFIDFGLGGYSKRIEDKGVDLKLLHDAIRATHYKILNFCWKFILEGYKKEYKNAEDVIKKIEEIEGRARYAKRDNEHNKQHNEPVQV
jgi:Kae1-associated kinase Bud32